jgi:hypothetical protein
VPCIQWFNTLRVCAEERRVSPRGTRQAVHCTSGETSSVQIRNNNDMHNIQTDSAVSVSSARGEQPSGSASIRDDPIRQAFIPEARLVTVHAVVWVCHVLV